MRDNKQCLDEKGMAAILITMIMMIVISLIVLGFSQITRHDQQQALNKQLSTEAFYAAESGVHDAINAVQNGYLTSPTGSPTGKSSCDPLASGSGWPQLEDNQLVVDNGTQPGGPDADTDFGHVSWTCLLINPQPKNLNYTVSQDPATVAVLDPVDSSGNALPGGASYDITINWQDKNSSNNFANCHSPSNSLYDSTSWTSQGCDSAGILRFDLIPDSKINGDGSAANPATALAADTFTGFAYPTTTGGSASMSYATGLSNEGRIFKTRCDTANNPACSMTITGIQGKAYLRLEGIYSDQAVSITGTSGGSAIGFANSQVVIDSTGSSNGVLRRIQVHVSLSGSLDYSPFALQSTENICKRFTTGGSTDPNPPQFNNPDPANISNTNNCFPNGP